MYYGVRTQDVPFEAEGDVMTHVSVVWEDGVETQEELPGVCALLYQEEDDIQELINRSRKIYGYGGQNHCYTALIGSSRMEYGMDPDEIILRNPKVFKVFDKGEC